jgi:hypothetical protein
MAHRHAAVAGRHLVAGMRIVIAHIIAAMIARIAGRRMIEPIAPIALTAAAAGAIVAADGAGAMKQAFAPAPNFDRAAFIAVAAGIIATRSAASRASAATGAARAAIAARPAPVGTAIAPTVLAKSPVDAMVCSAAVGIAVPRVSVQMVVTMAATTSGKERRRDGHEQCVLNHPMNSPRKRHRRVVSAMS